MPPFVLALRNFFPTALVLPFVAAATLWPALLLAAACFRWWDFVLPAPLFVPFAWSFAEWVGVPWPLAQMAMFHVAIYGLTFQTSNESWIFPLLRQQTKATLSGLGIGAVAVVPYFLFALKTTRPFDVPHAINLSIASFLGATYDGLLFLPVVFNLIVLTRFKRLPEQPELPDDDARILSTMALLFCLIALVPISLGPPIEPRQNIVAALASITAAVFSWQSSARPKVALFSGAIALVIIALDIVKSKPLAQIFAPGL